MEVMLQAVVVIFMLFLCALCLFAVVVIVRDMIYENAKTRRERDKEEASRAVQEVPVVIKPVAAEPVVIEQPVVTQAVPVVEQPVAPVVEETVEEPVVEETIEAPVAVEEVAVAEEEEEADNAVVFSSHVLTMPEKYATLSSEYKTYFDDIVKFALTKEGVKEFKFNNFYDYKIGSYRVVRIIIKRGEIVCEFSFIDRDFRNYANASNVRMKAAATSLKVSEALAVGVVKDGIDLICNQIAEDKEYKKQVAREKRREKRKHAHEA